MLTSSLNHSLSFHPVALLDVNNRKEILRIVLVQLSSSYSPASTPTDETNSSSHMYRPRAAMNCHESPRTVMNCHELP